MANGISNEVRVPTLIALMTYGLLKSVTTLTKPSTLSFNEIVDILQDYWAPKPPKTQKRNQGLDEDISAYVAALQKLTQHCEFGTFLNDSLRDHFVCGLCSTHIQKCLLSQEILIFKTVLEMVLSMEAATKIDTLQMTTPTLLPTTSATGGASNGRQAVD